MASSTKANPLDDSIVDTLGSLGATSGDHISASRQDNAKGRPSRRPGEYGGETPPRACADELTSPLLTVALIRFAPAYVLRVPAALD